MSTVFVTGAAGLLGGELCGALADRGHGVIGIVRRERTLMRGKGEKMPTGEWRGETPRPGEVLLVGGDVGEARLGLSAHDHAAIAAQTDRIVHGAALVSFDAPEPDYRRNNVDGTANALALAAARPGAPAGFIQISTAYVCGTIDGVVAEDHQAPSVGFANGYEASKYEAEALVRNAATKGVPAAIARPSIVIGREADGVIARFDAIYTAFKLLAEGRIGTIPAHPCASLDFVPLDCVVNGLVSMAERIDAAAGRAFHLTAGAPMPVADFFALIGRYPQFARPTLVEPDAFDAGALPPAERRLHRRVAPLYASYFRHNPLFAKQNAERLLGWHAPAADAALIGRQIDYAIAAGFLGRAKTPA